MSRRHFSYFAKQSAFTLVEVVVAITISSIIVGFVALFMTAPVDSYVAQVRRAELIDVADVISRSINTDIRTAVPDSVRTRAIGNFRLIEMLVMSGEPARYRPMTTPPDTVDTLSVSSGAPNPDDAFSTIGRFLPNLNAQTLFNNHRLLVATTGVNLYSAAGVMSPPGSIEVTPTAAGEARITMSAEFAFTRPSTTSKVFLVKDTVAYLCDLNTQTLRRYSGFPVTPTAAPHDTAAELNSVSTANLLLADNVATCVFRTNVRTAGARPLSSVQISLSQNGETLRIFEQVSQGLGP